MTQSRTLKTMVFLEGVVVPSSTVSVSYGLNVPASAEIRIAVTPTAVQIRPRTIVHVFFLDPDFQDTSDHREWPHAWKLMFEGEVVGFQYAKLGSARYCTLSCLDFSNWLSWIKPFWYLSLTDPWHIIEQSKLSDVNAGRVTSISYSATNQIDMGSVFDFSRTPIPNAIWALIARSVQNDQYAFFMDARVQFLKKIVSLRDYSYTHTIAQQIWGFNIHHNYLVNEMLSSGGPDLPAINPIMKLMNSCFYRIAPNPIANLSTAVPYQEVGGQPIRDITQMDWRPMSPRSRTHLTQASFFLLPQPCSFSVPPSCNVIFPEHVTSAEFSFDFMSEPTRLFITAPPIYNNITSMDFATAPESLLAKIKEFGGAELDITSQRILDDSYENNETQRGYRAITQVIPQHLIDLNRARGTEGDDPPSQAAQEARTLATQRLANYLFKHTKYSSRSLHVSGPFNPSPVLGVPAFLVDATYPCFFTPTTISHMIDVEGGAHTRIQGDTVFTLEEAHNTSLRGFASFLHESFRPQNCGQDEFPSSEADLPTVIKLETDTAKMNSSGAYPHLFGCTSMAEQGHWYTNGEPVPSRILSDIHFLWSEAQKAPFLSHSLLETLKSTSIDELVKKASVGTSFRGESQSEIDVGSILSIVGSALLGSYYRERQNSTTDSILRFTSQFTRRPLVSMIDVFGDGIGSSSRIFGNNDLSQPTLRILRRLFTGEIKIDTALHLGMAETTPLNERTTVGAESWLDYDEAVDLMSRLQGIVQKIFNASGLADSEIEDLRSLGDDFATLLAPFPAIAPEDLTSQDRSLGDDLGDTALVILERMKSKQAYWSTIAKYSNNYSPPPLALPEIDFSRPTDANDSLQVITFALKSWPSILKKKVEYDLSSIQTSKAATPSNLSGQAELSENEQYAKSQLHLGVLDVLSPIQGLFNTLPASSSKLSTTRAEVAKRMQNELNLSDFVIAEEIINPNQTILADNLDLGIYSLSERKSIEELR